MKMFRCACEAGSHAIDVQNETWAYVVQMIEEKGEDIPVEYAENGKTYLVPRMYIAKHGLNGRDLPALGFPEFTYKKHESSN